MIRDIGPSVKVFLGSYRHFDSPLHRALNSCLLLFSYAPRHYPCLDIAPKLKLYSHRQRSLAVSQVEVFICDDCVWRGSKSRGGWNCRFRPSISGRRGRSRADHYHLLCPERHVTGHSNGRETQSLLNASAVSFAVLLVSSIILPFLLDVHFPGHSVTVLPSTF